MVVSALELGSVSLSLKWTYSLFSELVAFSGPAKPRMPGHETQATCQGDLCPLRMPLWEHQSSSFSLLPATAPSGVVRFNQDD